MATDVNYESQRHQEIWDKIKGGAGPGPQESTGDQWTALASSISEIRGDVEAAIRGVRGAQEGQAADAAVAGISPMMAWVDHAQSIAHQVAGRISEQTSAFSHTNHSMPEVVPVSTDGGWKEWPVIDSVTTSDPEAEQARATEAERQAQQLMTSYQDATNSRLSEMPQFIRPPDTTTDVAFPGGQQVNPDQPGGGGSSVQPAGVGAGGGGGGVGGGGSVSPFPGVAGGPGAGGAGGSAAADPTGSQGFVPGGAGAGTGPAGTGGERPGTRPGAGAVPPGGMVPGAAAPRPGSIRGPGGAGGRMPGGGGTARPFGPTGSGFGARGSGSGGPGAGGGLGRGPESGARPGTGGAAQGPAPGARGPAGGAGTRGGLGGFAPYGIGAGRGQGGDDRDRQRPSYLIEQDPNKIVGKLPPTVPPVIGEDEPDDKR